MGFLARETNRGSAFFHAARAHKESVPPKIDRLQSPGPAMGSRLQDWGQMEIMKAAQESQIETGFSNSDNPEFHSRLCLAQERKKREPALFR